MSRGVGVTAVDFPSTVVVAGAVVTQLGDLWFAFSVCTLAYWLGSQTPRLGAGLTRERAAMAVALLVGAVTLTVSLKTAFALPRPPGAQSAPEATLLPVFARDLYVSMATGHGYGFPSGHATVAVSLWGGFAWAVRVGTRRLRAAVAATAVALVGLSRLVLGVHYLVDVLVGATVSGAFLWVALTRLRTPARVFGASAAFALLGLLVGGLSRDIGAAVGMSVGGTAVWLALPDLPEPSRRGAVTTVALGVVTGAMLSGVLLSVRTHPLAGVVFGAVGVALLLSLPLVGTAVAKKMNGVAA